MIILPDKNIPRAKFLMPIHRKEWITPSISQKKTVFGHEDVTRFIIRARTKDNAKTVWRGIFDDRDDFDQFIWALVNKTLLYDKYLWKLPVSNWSPYIGENLIYYFATQTILTDTSGTATYRVLSDWNKKANQIECLGASGGSGNIGTSVGNGAGGAGAGAYSRSVNLNITGNVVYICGVAGIGSPAGTGANLTGANSTGGDSCFNGTTLASCSCGAEGGAGGQAGGTGLGGAGGLSTNGVSTGTGTYLGASAIKYSGGNGGNGNGSGAGSGGGGGAAGPSGAGGNGAAATTFTGGSADGGTIAGGGVNTNGTSGTQFNASYGCGSGAGGRNSVGSGNAGGNYGGAPSGARSGGANLSGLDGVQGIIVVEYAPVAANFFTVF